MKKEDDEPKKLHKLLKKINSIKSEEVKKLIEKYITKILDIHLETTPQVIIFEYLEGSDLNEYLKQEDELSEQDFYFLITKIAAVGLLHNKLRIWQEILNLKISFMIKNQKIKINKFSCFLNDNSCYNKY